MLKCLPLAAKFLYRELRAGEWFLIFFALWLAIAAVTGLHFYTDRLQRGIDNLSLRLLGADLVVASPTPFPDAWTQKANHLQLKTTQVWTYPSVVSANNKLQLVNIQAIGANYPLIGAAPILLNSQTILVDSRLLPALNVKVHDTIMIGAATFTISDLIPTGFDVLNSGWIIAPRLIMRLADVPITKTVLPGSRVDYRLLLAGDKSQLAIFQQWLTPQLQSGQSFIDINNQRFPIHETLSKADNFIQLVLLVCLLMSGVVIALSIRQYLLRHFDYVALWRCLGAQEQQIRAIFIWQLIILALSAGIIGIVSGLAMQALLAQLLMPLLHIPLPPPGAAPIFLGFVTSLFLLFAYAYPLIQELPRISPLFIWRHEVNIPTNRLNYLYITLALLLIYIYWAMDFSLLVLLFLDALLLSIGFILAINIFLLSLVKKIYNHTDGVVRRGLSQLIQHPDSASMQMTAFSLLIMALLLLNFVRHHIISDWQSSLPINTPNYFAFNIAPTDLQPLQQFFHKNNIYIEQLYPIVRGRIIELNHQLIMDAIPATARAHNAFHRDLNLSWMLQYPSDNQITTGTTWTANDIGKPLASVEDKLAREMNLKIGDTLTFQIGDKKILVTVTNFRSVNWGSFHPNFYFIFPPGVANEFPTTYLTSFHLAANQTILLNKIVQQFPNITIIDVANVLQQIQAIIAKLTTAIEYLFYFAVGLGILIFIVSLQASMDERRETYSLLRILGASRAYIVKSVLVEFICLGVLIALLGVSLAKIMTYLMIKMVFLT